MPSGFKCRSSGKKNIVGREAEKERERAKERDGVRASENELAHR